MNNYENAWDLFPPLRAKGFCMEWKHVDFHLFTKDQLRVIYTWLRVVASALYGKALSKEINEIKETVKSAILEKNIHAGEKQRLIKALRKKKVRRDNQMWQANVARRNNFKMSFMFMVRILHFIKRQVGICFINFYVVSISRVENVGVRFLAGSQIAFPCAKFPLNRKLFP